MAIAAIIKPRIGINKMAKERLATATITTVIRFYFV